MGAALAAQQQGQGEQVVAGDLQGGIEPKGLAVVPLGGVEITAQLQQRAAVGVGPGAEGGWVLHGTTVGALAIN